MRVRLEEKARPSSALRDRGAGAQERPQQGEIELGLVDRVLGFGRRRPADHRGAGGRGPPAERVEVRQAPLGAPQHVERVQRRHTGAPLHQVDPGIRHDQPAARGADSEAKQQLLPPGAPQILGQPVARLPQRPATFVEQQRILLRPPRKHALGQTRHEDNVEAPSRRLLDAADEDPAEPTFRRPAAAEAQALAQDPLHLGQAHLVDLRQGPELGKHLEHGLRPAQRHRGQLLKTLEPPSPVRALGQGVEELDQGQRERLERLQAPDLPLQVSPVAFVLVPGLAQLQPELRAEAREPLLPAFGAADHGGVDQQALPLGGDAQRAGGRCLFLGFASVAGRGAVGRRMRARRPRSRELRRLDDELIARRLDPGHLALRRSAALRRFGGLAEGQVLGEAARGESLPRARQQGQEGAAGRIGAQRAPGDVGGDAGAAERVLHQGQVGGRLAKQDRHAIEGKPPGGGALDAPGDLDALLALAGRREQVDRRAGRHVCGTAWKRGWRGRLARIRRAAKRRGRVHTGLKDEALDPIQPPPARSPGDDRFLPVEIDHRPIPEQRPQPLQRLVVARGHGREHVPAARGERPQERDLASASKRQVEPQRTGRNSDLLPVHRHDGGAKYSRRIRQPETGHLLVESVNQPTQVAGSVVLQQVAGRNACRAQLTDRPRQGAGEAGKVGNRRQALQFPFRRGQTGDPSRHRLGSERGDRPQSTGSQLERRGLQRPLVERCSVDAQHPPTCLRQTPDQVVGGAARGRKQERLLLAVPAVPQPLGGRRQPPGRRAGNEDGAAGHGSTPAAE